MKRLLLFTTAILFSTLSIYAQCSVDLSFTTASTSAPYVVTLTATVNNGGTSGGIYIWDFGDGTIDTSNSSIITHTYGQNGILGVCVEYSGTPNCRVYDCDTLWLQGNNLPCSPAFQYVFQPNGSNTVTFNNYSSGSNPSFVWDFGDGTTSTAISPTHTYNTPGVYTPCLTITETNPNGVVTCTNTFCDSLLIGNNGNCSAVFQSTVSGSVAAFTATATGVAPYSYYWDFGDNSFGSTASPVHTYASSGSYTVCLTIMDASGCAANYCDGVTIINNSNCTASYTWFQDSSTASQVIIFDNTTGSNTTLISSVWDFGDGTSSTVNNPTHFYANSGWYYVCLTTVTQVSPAGPACTAVFCDSVYVYTVNAFCSSGFQYTVSPNGNNIISFTNYAYGSGALTYLWEMGDGVTLTTANPTYTYANPGVYHVCLTISDAIGCTSTYCDSVLIGNSSGSCHAAFTTNTNPVSNSISFANLSTGTNLAYTWDFGDGSIGTTTNPVHTYNQPGTYTVCLTITEQVFVTGCSDSICMTITVGNNPGNCSNFFTYTTVTTGSMATAFTSTVTGTAPFAYQWDFGDGTYSTLANPTHAYQVTGYYNVCLLVVDAANCTSYYCDSISVNNGNPNTCTAGFQYSATTNSLNSYQFYGYTGPVIATLTPSFTYDFGDGANSTLFNPTHTYATSGYYYVCVTVEFIDIQTGNVTCTAYYCDSILVGGPNTGSCYALFNFQQTSSLNTVAFYNQSTTSSAGSLSYYWTFDDNTTSVAKNPLHTFPGQGTYTVCLTIDDSIGNCYDQLCLPVVIGNNSYTLKGNVFKAPSTPVGNRPPAAGAVVYLIISDSTSLYAIDSTYTNNNGYYEFTNVPLGLYLVKAALSLNSVGYADYLPTYYGDELFWYNAATVIAGPVLVTVSHDINLIPGTNPGGPGFVGGLISQGANKQGPGDALGGIPVLLLNMDNSPVQYVYSNASGEYSFDDVAYGTYKVYAEVLGKPTYPAIVTIGPGAEEVYGVDIIVEKEQVTTGITDIDISIVEATGFYPNPVTHEGTLSFSLRESADINIRIINTLGQLVTEQAQYLVSGEHHVTLNLAGNAQGIYIVLIEANGKPAVYQRILKE